MTVLYEMLTNYIYRVKVVSNLVEGVGTPNHSILHSINKIDKFDYFLISCLKLHVHRSGFFLLKENTSGGSYTH